MKVTATETAVLADAVAELVESLHQKYPGIRTKPVPPIEDEDFAIEIESPASFSAADVEEECQKECIRLEDKYDVYILPLVVQKKAGEG
ncbi:MAG TPA: hypothetical protein DHV16_06615 [Nitrospiraceae bacterium]|nr:MAG: hypothetical protein A2Z82_04245 [Nitrospirae bacterium GWA2_46_11]OGW25861.1 MAG: hypothetical protein A2X55_03100 [Nitrospirae bacterium GWB2_47_37]HAK89241.1 hypothetical protein [Nitrospiraceae bacterium]HCL82019.1 hypothetical protein [Nitrospiraceae bacterium]HCZ11914.1 hypothetical protein [Nitrospiraceae bacterium]